MVKCDSFWGSQNFLPLNIFTPFWPKNKRKKFFFRVHEQEVISLFSLRPGYAGQKKEAFGWVNFLIIDENIYFLYIGD